MRNLKKILALALVFAMAFTFTASAADFTDAAEIGAKYVDDVNMLVELGVIAGYPDGSFGPQKNITRAEFAKMAYTIKYGSDTDGNLFAAQKSNFWDVEGNANVAWAKGYINYCANQNIVSGVGGGKFNPSGNITVAEATKMLLVILGCDPAKEGFTGANWVANVTAKAIDLGIYNGWTGDPSILATRELVAKLMRNTIFSSVYTYSAITGSGSQMDALGQNYNQTLGEQTMGLRAVTGIVVANERYELVTDEFGDALEGTMPNHRDDESVVYYTRKNSNGTTTGDYVVLDRVLDDDMLGAKVNVYFTADIIKNSNGDFLRYEDLKVLGNVLVHSDTVAYTVPAIATKVMPDASSNSGSTIRPYIAFEVDGVEKQVVASKDMPKVAKKVNAQTSTDTIEYDLDGNGTATTETIADAMKAEFAPYAYVVNGDVDDDGDLNYVGTYNGTDVNLFWNDFGAATLSQYRFISVDGGNTYSYIIKTVSGNTTANAAIGSVTAYNAERGTIKISGISALDLEDVVLVDEVAVDDYVAYYRANGKIYVEKLETVTAGVEDFTEDNGVVLNGGIYYVLDNNANSISGNVYTNYYYGNPSAMNATTKYLTFGNLIYEIKADDEVSVENSNYAVILNSYYDEQEQVARVKLGFADNTAASYTVGKLSTPVSSDLSDTKNDQATLFANNQKFGLVVQYKILDNGTVDLSAQNFNGYNDIASNETLTSNKDTKTYTDKFASGTKVVSEMAFKTNTQSGVANKYALNDSTIVFALYGNPDKDGDGHVAVDVCARCGKVEGDAGHGTGSGQHTYKKVAAGTAVSHKAYKLNDLKNLTVNAINGLTIANEAHHWSGTGDAYASYIVNTRSTNNNAIVAAAVTVGSSLSMGAAQYETTDNYAYVVSATQKYNSATDLYYLEMTLINDKEIFTAKTVDDVQTLSSQSFIDGTTLGKRRDLDNQIVVYDVDADGNIIMLDNAADSETTPLAINVGVGTVDNTTKGFYAVNIVSEKNGIVSFFDADSATYNVKQDTPEAIKYHEDGYTIIAIGEDSYEGTYLTKVSATEEALDADVVGANAVIQLDEGKIVRIYSFADGYFPG